MTKALAPYKESVGSLVLGSGGVMLSSSLHDIIKPKDTTKRDYSPWVITFLVIWAFTKVKNPYLRSLLTGVGVYFSYRLIKGLMNESPDGLGCPDCNNTCGLGAYETYYKTNHRLMPGYDDALFEYFFNNPQRQSLTLLAKPVYENCCNFYLNVKTQLGLWTIGGQEGLIRDWLPNLIGVTEPGSTYFIRIDRVAGQGGNQAISDGIPKSNYTNCNLPAWSQPSIATKPPGITPPQDPCSGITAATITTYDQLRCVHQQFPGFSNTVFGLIQYLANDDNGVTAYWRASGDACDLYNNVSCLLENLTGSSANVSQIERVTFTPMAGGRYSLMVQTRDGQTAIENYALSASCDAKCAVVPYAPPDLPSFTTPGGQNSPGDFLTPNPGTTNPPPETATVAPPFPAASGYIDDGSGVCWKWGQAAAYVDIFLAACQDIPVVIPPGLPPNTILTLPDSSGGGGYSYEGGGGFVDFNNVASGLPDGYIMTEEPFGGGYELAMVIDDEACCNW